MYNKTNVKEHFMCDTIDLSRPEIAFALRAVYQAADLVRNVQKTMSPAAMVKQDRSPVTVADFAAQALVAHLLHSVFPGQPLVAEEGADMLRDAAQREQLAKITETVAQYVPQATEATVCDWIARGEASPAGVFWTLDPIDGTKGFLRGDQYAVALAQIEAGVVQVAALGCPQLHVSQGGGKETGDVAKESSEHVGSILIAAVGFGTWRAPLVEASLTDIDLFERMRVSTVDDPRQVRVLRSVEAGHTDTDAVARLAAELGTQAPPVPLDSQAKYAVLAAGEGDLLVRLLSPSRPNYREKIWDQAAGSRVVEEAGGRVTDLDGRPLDFAAGRTLAENRGVLATNGHVHEAALSALRRIGA